MINFTKIPHRLLYKLGNDSPATILTILAINCLSLATIRPALTLYNPNESMEKKKYAALRESISELIGLPLAVGMGLVFSKWVAPAFFKKNIHEMDKDVIRKVFLIVGISSGNILIPFATTKAIDALGKHTKKPVSKLEPPPTTVTLQEPIRRSTAAVSAHAKKPVSTFDNSTRPIGYPDPMAKKPLNSKNSNSTNNSNILPYPNTAFNPSLSYYRAPSL